MIFTPQYYDEVPLIVKQARELGWKGPILGSDSWGSAELMNLCGNACKGLFFSTHYAAAGAKGATREFIDKYNAKYGYVPDDVAALTWSVNLCAWRSRITGGLTASGKPARGEGKAHAVKDIDESLQMTSSGRQSDSRGLSRSAQGEFEFFKSVCP